MGYQRVGYQSLGYQSAGYQSVGYQSLGSGGRVPREDVGAGDTGEEDFDELGGCDEDLRDAGTRERVTPFVCVAGGGETLPSPSLFAFTCCHLIDYLRGDTGVLEPAQ